MNAADLAFRAVALAVAVIVVAVLAATYGPFIADTLGPIVEVLR